ncbi:hypothetical protein WA026_023451 [Henosepilachna vigintioctopunctata]|uniref:Enoyl-CoA delta isomerase 2, mitochondrial n=1 Tax=Henosepilachna vigintioctopunctata TaxID=420089 RepID=A0AAW1UGT8_9CUCU
MEVTLQQGVRKLVFNRPLKKNAISLELYDQITKVLMEDAKNDKVVLTIITSKGEYFSSGNDFRSSLENYDQNGSEKVKNMIDAFIKYPKLIIAVVNGPAIGIAATFITLCDIVYCSDRATFEIPFIRLGLCLEGCSSLMFPLILGKSKALEMLFLNHILTAREAHNLGFVAKIISHEKLEEFIQSLYKFGTLPVETVKKNKEMLTRWSRDLLLKVNKKELEVVSECVRSEEFGNALKSFMLRKSKL